MTDHLINGTSLITTVGFRPENGRRHSSAGQDNQFVGVHGRPGGLFTNSSRGLRTVQFTGHIAASSVANRLAAEDELKRLLAIEGFTYTYTRTDSTSRLLTNCRQKGEVVIEPIPDLNFSVSRCSFAFESEDHAFRASSDTTVTLSSTATPFSVALGTADSDWVLTIVGGTNPVVTIKDGSAATLYTLTFTVTLGSDELILDSYRGTIERDDGSPPLVNAIDTLTSGGVDWPFQFKREWYSGATAPTIEISAGGATSALVYTKRYH